MIEQVTRGERGKMILFLRNVSRSILSVVTAASLWVVISLWVVSLSSTNTLYAQTDFNIKAGSADLKAEFQKELDAWMLRAYGGDRDAQFKVGVLFSNDQFGPPDHEQSAYWYTQAARQGHVLAQYNLGHLHLLGNGVKRDEAAAMQWWLKAAEQQHALAQFNIGRAYYLGIGLKKDLALARLWFERASQNNEPKSTEILKQLGWWDEESVAAASQPVPSQDMPETTGIESVTNLAETNAAEIVNSQSTEDTDTSSTESTVIAATNPSTGEAVVVPPANSAITETAEIDNSANAPKITQRAISAFTNPAVRSVLVTILDSADELVVVKENNDWTIVRSNKGLPVWVNKNFIRVANNRGIIIGSSVNARSVPLITSGSIVGRLNKNEPVTIIDNRGDWYRIIAPTRFKAWVRTADYERSKNAPEEPATSAQSPTAVTLAKYNKSINDNEWLYKQKKRSYTLQLASFDDPKLVTQFIDKLPFKDSDDLRLYTTFNEDGKEWTYILYGSLGDESLAKETRVNIKQKQAWIRRFGVLQQNRCLAWKRELPAPKELNQYCLR